MSGADTLALAPRGGGPIGGLDPRVRIVTCIAFALVTVTLHGALPVLSAFAAGLAAAAASGIRPLAAAKRLIVLEGFMVVLLLTLPFTVPGEPLIALGPLAASTDGLVRAAMIALKANAVVLMVLALLGTLEPARLGHGLYRLGVPRRFVTMLLLTVRYIAVFEDEYRRLRRAMAARAFRATSSRHAWRSLGYLVGMLLVRSNDRAERVLAAMKCRGFTGRFHMIAHLGFSARDALFAAAALAAMAGLLAWDRL